MSSSTSALADSGVNEPSICALHPQIFSLITGEVTNSPPIKIANCFPTITSVILQKILFHASLKLITATGCPV